MKSNREIKQAWRQIAVILLIAVLLVPSVILAPSMPARAAIELPIEYQQESVNAFDKNDYTDMQAIPISTALNAGTGYVVGPIEVHEGNETDYIDDYTTRLLCVIDHTAIDAPMEDFVVRVHLDADNFDFTLSNSDGYDVRFTAGNDTELLCYDREHHSDGTELADYWVKIPDVYASYDTHFFLYFRTTDTADGANATCTWSDYSSVYHMTEADAAALIDSTTQGYDLTKSGSDAPADASGNIYKYQLFDGDTDYAYAADPIHEYEYNEAFTVEFWIYSTQNEAYQTIIGDWEYGGNWRGWGIAQDDTNLLNFSLVSDGSNLDKVKGSTAIFGDSTWHHVMASYDGTFTTRDAALYTSSFRIFVDGEEEDLTFSFETLTTGETIENTEPFRIGAQDGYRFYKGGLDEVRIISAELNNVYAKASYRSGTGTLVTVVSEATAGIVYLDNNCESFPHDIEFTDNDQSTQLWHWADPFDVGPVRDYYVKVNDDLTGDGSGNISIYIHYGKAVTVNADEMLTDSDFWNVWSYEIVPNYADFGIEAQEQPDVVYEASTGKWHFFGEKRETETDHTLVYYGWTTDLNSALNNEDRQIIILPGAAGKFDDDATGASSIVYKDGTWHCWYSGMDYTAPHWAWSIGYANTTAELFPLGWTKYAGAETGDAVLHYDAGGVWEDWGVAAPKVWWQANETCWHMVYEGFREDFTSFQIGAAKSNANDPLVWTRSGSNPVIALGAADEFDDVGCAGPSGVWVDSTFYCHYSADNIVGQDYSKQGMAYSDYPYNGFTKIVDNPIYVPGGIWDDPHRHNSPAIVDAGDSESFHVWYQQYHGVGAAQQAANYVHYLVSWIESDHLSGADTFSAFDSFGGQDDVLTGNWTARTGSDWAHAAHFAGQEGYTANGAAGWNVETFGNISVTANVLFFRPPDEDYRFVGVGGRMTNANDTWAESGYQVRIHHGNDSLELCEAGVVADVTDVGPVDWTNPHTIGLQMYGSSIRYSFDGVEQGNITDTTYTSGYASMFDYTKGAGDMYDDSDASYGRIDYFSIAPYVYPAPAVGIIVEAPNIDNIPQSYNFGVVNESNAYPTGIDYFTLTNNSLITTVDIYISAGNMTGGIQWTLSDTCTPASMVYGLKAGVSS